jgi:hypothetical protein
MSALLRALRVSWPLGILDSPLWLKPTFTLLHVSGP